MKKLIILCFSLFAILATSAQVSKTIEVSAAGTLTTLLTASEKSTLTSITLTGVLDARDIKCIRDEMPLVTEINMSSVIIQLFSGLGGTYPWGDATYPENEFPKYAFFDTSKSKTLLKSIILPEGITAIGESAFYECHGLIDVNVPDAVTTIRSYAFQQSENLTTITLGKKVNFIDLQCFYNCPNLRNIYSRNPTPPALSGNPFTSTDINIVYVPSGSVNAYKNAVYWGLKTDGQANFNIGIDELVQVHNPTAGGLKNEIVALGKNISAITQLKVTGLLNSIDIKVLKDELVVLIDLDLSGATLVSNLLPNNAFNGKNSLVSIKLPESLTIIGDYAFTSCTNITSNVPLPRDLVSIGKFAFNGCLRMTGGLHFPPSLTTIGESAFSGCTGLKGTISFPESVTTIQGSAFNECTGLSGQLVLPNSITSIGSYAFQKCQNLSGSLILPSQLVLINSGLFYRCSSLSGALNVPASVQEIKGSAFFGCNQLTEINLGGKITGIGAEAFYNCSGITKISSPQNTPPVITSNTFGGSVDKNNTQLQVPYGALAAYQSDALWKAFKNISEVEITYNLKVLAGQNGTVKANNVVVQTGEVLVVNKNATKSFTFTPDNGYIVYSLAFNGVNVLNHLSNNAYTTPLITDSSTLEVTFEKAHTISISIENATGGSVSANNTPLANGGNILLVEGESVTFNITPAEGYWLESLKFGGNPVILPLTDNQFSTGPVTQDVALEVKFKKITYDVTILLNAGGTVKENNVVLTNNSKLNVAQNAVLSFNITPNSGFEIDTLQYGGSPIALINYQYQTAPINTNDTLYVRFKESQTKFNITLQTGEHGVVSENNIVLKSDTILKSAIHSTRTFVIIPDAGYATDKVFYGGRDITSTLVSGQFTTALITADATLSVTFKQLAFTLTLLKGDGGKVFYNNTQLLNNDVISAEPGTTKTFTITPDTGYGIDVVRFNTTDVKGELVNNTYTTGAVTGNGTLTVTFKQLTFKITVTSGTGGTVKDGNTVINNNTVLTVNENSTKTFTFLPNSGYVVSSLTFGGANVMNKLINNNYTTPPITSDVALNVSFSLNSYTPSCYLNVTLIGKGKISASGFLPSGGTNPVPYGSTTQLTITPDPGYVIDSLLYENADVRSAMVGNIYTTPQVVKDGVTYLKIVFRLITHDVKILTGNGGKIKSGTKILPNDTVVSAASGLPLIFSVTPDTGYELDSLRFGGKNVKDSLVNNQLTTVPVTKADTLKAVFKKKVFNIKIQYSTGGTISLGTGTLANDT
ncbi:MAG: leucine-rich repeat domain-containing protein, partial [Bacteroidia bacterium]|nr:leucine-rich repeat domain-containing protein [Bacteroidia bacterium]